MSISPPRNRGSTSSSSSQILPQNPNFEHGSVFPQPHPLRNQLQHAHSHRTRSQSPQSVRISNFRSLNAMSDEVSAGPVAPAPEDAAGSFKKVNEAGKQSGKRTSGYNKDGKVSQSYACNQAGVRSAQHRGKLSETIGSQRGQRSYGSTSSKGTAAHSAGRKSQMVNGNHLLNFYYDPISRMQPRAPPPRRQQRKQPYNKDLFLQANYKFVLLDSGNYSPMSMDPDKTLQWEDIVYVKYSTPVPIQCPICLEDPLCPQITSCGHIFCFPCILRYFFIGEDDYNGECWKKCPLCFMMISSKDLYTIYVENVMQHCVGDAVEFMLLTRQKDSFILSLKNKQGRDINEEVCDSFSKFTFTSDVNLSIRKAMSELDSWLARADSGLVDDLERLPYVCAAMDHLEERKKYWNCHQGSIGPDACKSSDCHPRSPLTLSATIVHHGAYEFPPGAHFAGANNKYLWLGNSISEKIDGDPPCMDQTADVVEVYEDQDGGLSSFYDDSKSTQRHTKSVGNRTEKDSYSFYQAADGQHLILHPLNMKCLLHHYGSYEKLPHRIYGKILQLETVTQSEAMRRRYRYLSHFSLTTTFQLCEIDLNESLPPGAFSPFIGQIKNREKQRKRLARKEREEKIKSEAVAKYVILPADLAQSSSDSIPTFSKDEFEALGSSVVTSSSPPTVGERPLFSNVARLGFAAGHDSPALKTEAAHSRPKAEVWTDTSDATGLTDQGRTSSSFANIISRANPPVEPTNKISGLGKKGKKPNRVLLSTAGVRRY